MLFQEKTTFSFVLLNHHSSVRLSQVLSMRDSKQSKISNSLCCSDDWIVRIASSDFLPIPEHYSECEGSTCVSTLGTFHRALVETKECGPGPGQERREQCGTRQLGGGATVTVCHCGQNFCNKFSVQDPARHTGHWGHWWSQLWDLLQVNI